MKKTESSICAMCGCLLYDTGGNAYGPPINRDGKILVKDGEPDTTAQPPFLLRFSPQLFAKECRWQGQTYCSAALKPQAVVLYRLLHHSVSIWNGVALLAVPWSGNVHTRPKDKPFAPSTGQIATMDPQDRRESEEQDSYVDILHRL